MLTNLRDYFAIKHSGLFDEKYYLLHNPDVRRADIDPLKHFVKYGWKEGRNPSESFNTNFYIENHPSVKSENINPLVHYILHERKEYRKSKSGNKGRELNIQDKNVQKIIILKSLISLKNINKSLSYIRVHGIFAFFRKTKLVVMSEIHKGGQIDKPINILNRPVFSSYFLENELKLYDEKISIIIPTKNAGPNFEYLLKVLNKQKGFKKLEIIIVDSGSTDDTLLIAKEHNAIIIKILPEEFSHSYARNLGAESASGDFLFFTVQDALPPTLTWLYDLMNAFFDNNVSAVSCAEFPRENVDLFYRIICWNHYNFLGVNGKDRIFKLPSTHDHVSLRQNGQLSDIACLIPRNIFMNYKYIFNYAEDLDLGIRLIEDGKQIAFLGSTKIIHSHDRPASYFLKRGYVDNLFLSDMFTDFPVPRINFKDFIPDIAFTYNFINEIIINALSNVSLYTDINSIKSLFIETFSSAKNYTYPLNINLSENKFVDSTYLELLDNILSIEEDLKFHKPYRGFLINAFLDYSNIMFNYLRISYEYINKGLLEEIKICINKELAQLIGAHLSYCYINSSMIDKDKFEPVHIALKRGI
ncbi:MAG: putative glycosyl transferase [Firmicutes bacterium ADurb.Bin419]|jgi:glycosyltransferase involved in cell wall biosynthesis|nr:glycosyltransferase family 2 protein [Caldisericia bacterium]OPZ91980.1 MAG: putative glycosyl transferase [Firmicutes bacterium ADurb.Bin419]